ncbi:PWWP domain-containing protein [Cephalotus follicularis]|uniref:PWWP domain-containing protein n=1 Tax=Cephalotus follicularis TaxID=3775 RepID=A0A1Q3D023_CEPFO|nr:PWWP domain-containing protein [Cephalotus follicularis]
MVYSMKNVKLTKRDMERVDDLKKSAAKPFECGPYEFGDMVWGKVKSHPWWPGRVFDETFALPSVRKTKREGQVLVSFFGDGSYRWFDPVDLVPFDDNYVEESKQSNTRRFVRAVEEAENEVGGRAALGLACRCRNPCNFRPMSVEGYFEVLVSGYEPEEIYTVKQIKMARDEFLPVAMLCFVKGLALIPRGNLLRTVDRIKDVASVLAYRKAVFEEFDQVYDQVFDEEQPKQIDAVGVLNVQEKLPRQASLSGPLKIPEASKKVRDKLKSSKHLDELVVSRICRRVRHGRFKLLSTLMYEENTALGAEDHAEFPLQEDANHTLDNTSAALTTQVDANHTLDNTSAALSPSHTSNDEITVVERYKCKLRSSGSKRQAQKRPKL